MARNTAYRKAEKKIEAARRAGSEELNLSNSLYADPKRPQLTELPASLGQLTQLKKLSLYHNQIEVLPEWLGQLTQLQELSLYHNQIEVLPEWLGQLTQLQELSLSHNQLMALPESIGHLTKLRRLDFSNNRLTMLPESISNLLNLEVIYFHNNHFTVIPKVVSELVRLETLGFYGNKLKQFPEWLGQMVNLKEIVIGSNGLTAIPNCISQIINLRRLYIAGDQLTFLPSWIDRLINLTELHIDHNKITDLPFSLVQLKHLTTIALDENPLKPELAEAYKQGLDAVKAYLRAKADAQITLDEAKLILVGEGEVGKSCLLGALRGDPWEEGRPTTHGIEIKPVKITDQYIKKEITLNGWDFGGQRVYRPTHQLFFSAPAVYLVVWKPREGPQQGFVREWIQLIKRREPDAKILVVATHGGPQQRQPDIDRQELWDLFGKDTVIDFFFVDSKPDGIGERRGIEALKCAIARVASMLPEMGRSVPKSFQEARQALQDTSAAYLSFERVLSICRENGMDGELARLFVSISHRLGHLIHYAHDPAVRDIVVLKPDWLATAIGFVLDDETTRIAHGLVRLSRLSHLWNAPDHAVVYRYPVNLHQVFLRLMERFDLSYRVACPSPNNDVDPESLIAQLVPDCRPEKDLEREWTPSPATGDIQQVQICRIVDDNGQSANAEGLFYQLIVRLHKYSLGRANYKNSVHWQRGLILDDDYNGRALMEYVGNDVRITVRAPYPERFLAMLTAEVKYLVESFWEGLRCDVMVPCITPCGRKAPGTGLFEVQKLIESKRKNRPEYPCPVCNEWQDIDLLLRNAPAVRPVFAEELFASREVFDELRNLRHLLIAHQADAGGRFDRLDAGQRELLSKADASFTGLMQALTDEAKEGPRLFSLVPVDRSKFNPKEWSSAKFRLTLWCEHSRLPLPNLDGKDSKKGVYEIDLTREWFKKSAPFLKVLTGTLSLVLPVASSGIKLSLDDTAYKAIEEQLDFGKAIIDSSLKGSEKISGWLGSGETVDPEHGEMIRARGATLRELHALLKVKDLGFGGLVRVMNKREEFLWVHPQFEKEY